MSVKAPRGLTHAKRLLRPRGVGRAIDAGMARAAATAAGVLLVQLHPAHERDDARLDYFLARPADVDAGRGRVPPPDAGTPTTVFAVLERHGAAYVVMSGAHCRACCERRRRSSTSGCTDPTTSISTRGSYSDDDLRWWADRIREWLAQDRDVTATSTTTGMPTRSATPAPFAPTSAPDRRARRMTFLPVPVENHPSGWT